MPHPAPRFLAIVLILVLVTVPLAAQPLAVAKPASVGISNPASVGMSASRLARLDRALEAYVEESRLPGGVVLVSRRGRLVYHRAFGYRDLESQSPMRTDDIFRIASQTKAIVSVAILLLQERGELLISDPLAKFLPAFSKTTVAVPKGDGGYDIVEAERPITIRHLLTHTSGYGYGAGLAADLWAAAGIQGWYFANLKEPIAHTVKRMASLPADARPGERFIYGYSTDILGAVVEAVSGLSLDEFLHTEIFEPLGMQDTHFYLPPEKASRLVTVYSATPEGLERAADPGHMVGQGAYVTGPRVSYSGGAGLLSTAADYARFLQMLLAEGRSGERQILSPATVELMTANHVGDKFAWDQGTGFGLGVSVVLDPGARGQLGSAGEYGWGGAYHSSYWVDPEEELVVVYLTQVIPAGDLDDHGRLRALVYSAITQ